MPEQQREDLGKQIRVLREKLSAFIDDLRAMQKQYKNDSALQIEEPHLSKWFPHRISAFEDWKDKIQRALDDKQFRRSSSFDHTLGEFYSLGQALDANTEWSEYDEPMRTKSGEMIELSSKIRSRLNDH